MHKSNAEEIRSEWFKDHVASYSILDKWQWTSIDSPVTIIKWVKPGTGIYGVIYIIRNNRLYVSGDIGDAVYCWGPQISFKFLAELSLDYFASKCSASEGGRGYKSWDADKAQKNLMEHIKSHLAYCAAHDDDSIITNEMVEGHIYDSGFWLSGIDEMCSTRESFYAKMSEFGYDLLGDDWYELTFGEIIDMRCEGHLIGLKMAYEQLNEKL